MRRICLWLYFAEWNLKLRTCSLCLFHLNANRKMRARLIGIMFMGSHFLPGIPTIKNRPLIVCLCTSWAYGYVARRWNVPWSRFQKFHINQIIYKRGVEIKKIHTSQREWVIQLDILCCIYLRFFSCSSPALFSCRERAMSIKLIAHSNCYILWKSYMIKMKNENCCSVFFFFLTQ